MSRLAVAVRTHSIFATIRLPVPLKRKVGEVRIPGVSQQNYVASMTAVAAVRAAFRSVFFATEAQSAVPTISTFDINRDTVDKHDEILKP
jgi:hypothetical protein